MYHGVLEQRRRKHNFSWRSQLGGLLTNVVRLTAYKSCTRGKGVPSPRSHAGADVYTLLHLNNKIGRSKSRTYGIRGSASPSGLRRRRRGKLDILMDEEKAS